MAGRRIVSQKSFSNKLFSKQDTGMKVADKNYCLRIADETKADEEGFKDKMKERIKLIKTQGYEGELAKLSQIHNQRN